MHTVCTYAKAHSLATHGATPRLYLNRLSQLRPVECAMKNKNSRLFAKPVV